MKCDKCDSEATFHDLTIRNGARVERHLCERCAAAQGMSQQPAPVVTQIIAQVVTGGGGAAGGAGQSAGACEGCGLTFAQFRQAGMLGCARCYGAFEGQLGPLISRAHEGGTHHVGKVPRSAAGKASAEPGATSSVAAVDLGAQQRARAAQLRKQLSEAVASEHYERAAALRDELQRIEQSLSAGAEVKGAAGQPSLSRPRRARGGGKPASGEGA